MPLWTGEEFLAAIGGRLSGGALPGRVDGISIDSRSLQKGDAFFAIKGGRADGHDYLPQAAAAGAALLVADAARLQNLPPLSAPVLGVNNVQEALEALARAARARLSRQAKVAAITGSVGKTTVKEMLAAALGRFGKTHFSPASFNNHWGVPLSLARMPRDTDYAVFEIGMSHAGEIAPLVKMVRPHLALITRIAAAHLGHFNGLAEIAAAKAEIFSGLEYNGAALLPRDDGQYEFLRQKLCDSGHFVSLSFGRDKNADYCLAKEQALPQGQEITILHGGKAKFPPIRLNAAGAHMAENACAAIAAAAEMTGAVNNAGEKTAAGLAQFHPGAGRGARLNLKLPSGGAFVLIDESYNANQASMRAALALLAQEKRRKIAVLGDMLELGTAAQAEHEKLAAEIIAAKADYVFLIGAEMRFLRDKLRQAAPNLSVHWQENAAGLAKLLEKTLQNGDALMLKGSNSVGLGAVAQALKAAFQALP